MKAARRGAAFAEINVTPMVDVMLVLLIIFMVAAPLLDQGIDVVLPKAGSATRAAAGRGLALTLTKEHVVYFNEQVVTMKELRQQLSHAPHQPILIRADRNAYVSRLVELWDVCRDAGFQEIRIATLSE